MYRTQISPAILKVSYAQTDPELKAALRANLVGFRERCVPLIKR